MPLVDKREGLGMQLLPTNNQCPKEKRGNVGVLQKRSCVV